MLKFAKLHEKELQKAYYNVICEEKYKWVNINYISGLTIDSSDWDYVQRVSIRNDNVKGFRVLGFMSASIQRASNKVTQLILIGLPKDLEDSRAFEIDILEYLVYLLKNFRKISWTCCLANPVINKYRKLIEAIGGRIVGISLEEYMINGEYFDAENYEVLSSPEVISKIEKLMKERRK